jgi:hypothetical protein
MRLHGCKRIPLVLTQSGIAGGINDTFLLMKTVPAKATRIVAGHVAIVFLITIDRLTLGGNYAI